MVLPAGVNKASGLKAALSMLDIAAHNVIAVGDAENDHTFLGLCGCAAAVANALPAIRDEADIKLSGDYGAGVVELIRRSSARTLASFLPRGMEFWWAPTEAGRRCSLSRTAAC